MSKFVLESKSSPNLITVYLSSYNVARLKRDPSEAELSAFAVKVGIEQFLSELKDHPALLDEIPSSFNVRIAVGGFEMKPFFSRQSLQEELDASSIIVSVSLNGLTAEKIWLLPEVQALVQACKARKEKEEQERLTLLAQKRQEKEEAHLLAVKKAHEILQGSTVEKVDGKNIYLISPQGESIRITSVHDVWDYGDASDDALLITKQEHRIRLSDGPLDDNFDP
jgi:hypothetical protein